MRKNTPPLANKSSSDTIKLFDSSAPPTATNSALLDSHSYSKSMGIDISFARIPDGDDMWATSSASLGYLNETGESCEAPEEETLTISPVPQIKNIYISEAYVNPNTGEKEWIELYNDNDTEVTLVDWVIDDIEDGGSSPKTFSLTISAKGYASYTLSSSMFNNTEDAVRLINDVGEKIDSFEYESSTKGLSIGKVTPSSSRVCQQNTTQNGTNTSCVSSSSSSTATPTKTPTPGKVLGSSTSSTKKTISSSSQKSVKKALPQFPGILKPQSMSFTPKNAHTNNSKKAPPPAPNPYVQSLSFASFSYAALTAGKLLFKIRQNLYN